jgi:putative Holliday junction resolvase
MTIQCVIGFDYGSKRLGVAVGQTVTATARPLATVPVNHQQPDWTRISALIQEWQPQALVVGIPSHADGSENAMTVAARCFCQQLQEHYQLPVYTIDERLSSVAAANLTKKTKKSAKEPLDAVAAQIILESWLAMGQF